MVLFASNGSRNPAASDHLPDGTSMAGRVKLILASGSPRRLALLAQIGVEPDRVMPVTIDETPKKSELSRNLAKRLAEEKANAAIAAGQDRSRPRRRSDHRRRHRGQRRPPHPRQGRDHRGGRRLPAPALRPRPSRPYRRGAGERRRAVAPPPGRDARALQAAVARGCRFLSRLRRMARQGRRLRRAGHRRRLRRQAHRLLFQCRRPAALRDDVAAHRRGLSRFISTG